MLYNTLWALGMPSIGQGETFTDQPPSPPGR